jgi:RNA polymerase sigma-70 factor (ECF subfamily)
MSFASCWSQAAAGDDTAFAMFYRRHAGRVFAHCYSRVGCRADAEDLTARVFEIAWRRRSEVRVDAQADILPWLLTTANHLTAEHHRATIRRWRLLPRLPMPEDEPDHAVILVEHGAHRRDLELAMSILAALRPVDREVIELCILGGLSPTAAAVAIGAPASTVRTRLARALARARRDYRAAACRTEGPTGD